MYDQWKPRSTTSVIWLLLHFWFTIFSSCLRYSLMRFLSILNFLEADEIFLQFSKVTRVWLCISLISGVYDFLSVYIYIFFFFFFFFEHKRHATPRKHSENKTFEMRMLSLTWWHSIALALWMERMASCTVKLELWNLEMCLRAR